MQYHFWTYLKSLLQLSSDRFGQTYLENTLKGREKIIIFRRSEVVFRKSKWKASRNTEKKVLESIKFRRWLDTRFKTLFKSTILINK